MDLASGEQLKTVECPEPHVDDEEIGRAITQDELPVLEAAGKEYLVSGVLQQLLHACQIGLVVVDDQDTSSHQCSSCHSW